MIRFLGCLAVVLLEMAACASASAGNVPNVKPEGNQMFVSIEAEAANGMVLTNISNPGFAVVDVRSPEDFKAGHITNALNYEYNSPGFTIGISSLDKNKTYLVYCKTGHRSALAMDIMKKLGFSKVFCLFGGLDEWANRGCPVYR
jgi:rhodanese-related sulfurtransferase